MTNFAFGSCNKCGYEVIEKRYCRDCHNEFLSHDEGQAAEVERLRQDAGDNAKLVRRIMEMGKEADERNLKLKRFTDRESKIDAIKQATIEDLPKAVCELEAWEQENPKP